MSDSDSLAIRSRVSDSDSLAIRSRVSDSDSLAIRWGVSGGDSLAIRRRRHGESPGQGRAARATADGSGESAAQVPPSSSPPPSPSVVVVVVVVVDVVVVDVVVVLVVVVDVVLVVEVEVVDVDVVVDSVVELSVVDSDVGSSVVDEVGGEGEIPRPEPVGWVYVELETSALDAEWRATMMTTLGLAFVIVLLTALLAAQLTSQVSRPLARLADAVKRIAGGERDVQVSDAAGSEELHELQQGFNSMARAIDSAHQHMQARIDEATERLAYQAMHDPLTALPNRRAFELALAEMVATSRRVGDHGALCFIDLDNFKTVNDTVGHAAGDALLCQVAEIIKGACRRQDC